LRRNQILVAVLSILCFAGISNARDSRSLKRQDSRAKCGVTKTTLVKEDTIVWSGTTLQIASAQNVLGIADPNKGEVQFFAFDKEGWKPGDVLWDPSIGSAAALAMSKSGRHLAWLSSDPLSIHIVDRTTGRRRVFPVSNDLPTLSPIASRLGATRPLGGPIGFDGETLSLSEYGGNLDVFAPQSGGEIRAERYGGGQGAHGFSAAIGGHYFRDGGGFPPNHETARFYRDVVSFVRNRGVTIGDFASFNWAEAGRATIFIAAVFGDAAAGTGGKPYPPTPEIIATSSLTGQIVGKRWYKSAYCELAAIAPSSDGQLVFVGEENGLVQALTIPRLAVRQQFILTRYDGLFDMVLISDQWLAIRGANGVVVVKI
jgi:hypothetical protein